MSDTFDDIVDVAPLVAAAIEDRYPHGKNGADVGAASVAGGTATRRDGR